MSDDVTILQTVTSLQLPVSRVITGALEAKVEDLVLIGIDENGEFYMATNTPSVADALLYLRKAEHKILESVDL